MDQQNSEQKKCVLAQCSKSYNFFSFLFFFFANWKSETNNFKAEIYSLRFILWRPLTFQVSSSIPPDVVEKNNCRDQTIFSVISLSISIYAQLIKRYYIHFIGEILYLYNNRTYFIFTKYSQIKMSHSIHMLSIEINTITTSNYLSLPTIWNR